MTFAPTREIRTDRESLLERGYDFGFGSFFPGGLLGGLPQSAQTIIQSILDSPAPAVISEIPQTWEEYEEQYPEYFEPILETRPGRTPDPYPQDIEIEVTREQLDKEDEPMAHDWGHLAREFIGGVATEWISPAGIAPSMGPVIGPGSTANQLATAAAVSESCDGMTWGGGAPPKGYKVVRDSCGNGVLRKVRRRRRRRMLTQGDKSDIAAIVSMVGKGQLASSLINRATS